MKKFFLVGIIALITFTLIGTSVYAWRGSSGVGGAGCPMYGSIDPEKAQKFYNDTLPLRQKQLQLRSELMHLYAQPAPDWNAIGKKQQEMTQLRTEMQRRAHEQGIPYFGKFGKRW